MQKKKFTSNMMARGQPAKRQKPNISGLHNLGSTTESPSLSVHSTMNTNIDTNHDNSDKKFGELAIQFDSTRVDWEREDRNGSDSDIGSNENITDLDDLEDEEFAQRLVEMAMIVDENDMDWVPAMLRTKERVKKS